MANRIDSNATGLRFAEEVSLKTLPGSPVWYPLEPNKYTDFGSKIATVARNPINAARQRNKGTVTDLDASAGFTQDFIPASLVRLLQGFLFADAREKPTTGPITGAAAIPITSISGTQFLAASGLTIFLVNHLILGQGFGVAANNSVHKASVVATGAVTASGLAAEASPPAGSFMSAVGYEFASATLDVQVNSGIPRLNRASGAVDFTTLGLVPGEWIYVGGDTAPTHFVNNIGWARVLAVAVGYIDLDKTDWTPQAEVGTGLTVQIYFGTVIKNESNPALIKRRSYQLERTLGADANGTMSEYVTGAIPNELSIDFKQADKVTSDLTFVGCDVEQRTGTTGVKSGSRPSLTATDAFNTTSDFHRIKLSLVDAANPNPTALFAYVTDLNLKMMNNVTPAKALGVLGAMDTTAGTYAVDGKVTAYFSDVTAAQAVKNNSDVTLDVIMVKKNKGFAFDVPLITLGDGRLNVEQDKPIMIPLDLGAAAGAQNHTLLFCVFAYTPTAAD
jgi:hypothetical protein